MTQTTAYLDELDAHWPAGSIMTFSSDAPAALWLLLPALAQLSQRNRWVVWVSPPRLPSARMLEGLGLNLSHTLFAHRRDDMEDIDLIEQALLSKANDTVLAWPRRLDAPTQLRLRGAANAGRTRGLLFYRQDLRTRLADHRSGHEAPHREPEQLSFDVGT